MDQNASENVLFIGFNQDCECFMCGIEDGYRIYNTEPLKENTREIGGGVKRVEMLYKCNYVGIVPGGKSPKYSTNKAIIWDDFQKKVAITLEFNTEVLAIRLRRDRIAVIFEKLVKVYTFSQSPQLLHVFETHHNPTGICCLCSMNTNSNLAHLGKNQGQVSIIDLADTSKSPIEISAHEAPVSCLALSNEGSTLATSSSKGTLIRVFNTENGGLLHELRRGASHASIFSINFNKGATKLCVSSDRGTIHVFILDSPEKNSRSSLANATFLPKYFQSKWSSFKFDINNNSKCICAFTRVYNELLNLDQELIIAICADGTYYKYSLNSPNNVKDYQLELCKNFLELQSSP